MASNCRLPKTLAFAVKGTSRMDSRVIGDVERARFGPTGTRGEAPAARGSTRRHVHQAAGTNRQLLGRQLVAVSPERVALSGSVRSRICSDTNTSDMNTGEERHVLWRGFSRPDARTQDVDRCAEHIAERRRLIPGRAAGLANTMLVRPDGVCFV